MPIDQSLIDDLNEGQAGVLADRPVAKGGGGGIV